MRSVPGRDRPSGGAARAVVTAANERLARGRAGAPRRHRPGNARRFDLRARPDSEQRDRERAPPARDGPPVSDVVGPVRDPMSEPPAGAAPNPLIVTTPPARSTRLPVAPPQPVPGPVELTIDGVAVSVPAGSTILEACRAEGIDTPTLCYLENLTPVNVCRVCVVELTGSRVLVPACSRRVEPGMEIQTDSERVRHSRKVVLELLGSSVDLSIAGPASPDGDLARYAARYDVDAARFGPPADPADAGVRDAATPGHHHPPEGAPTAATVAQPVKVDNDLYVRDYSRCILCYKCVEACGEDAQNTFAISVAGRGFDARISTEFDVPLP